MGETIIIFFFTISSNHKSSSIGHTNTLNQPNKGNEHKNNPHTHTNPPWTRFVRCRCRCRRSQIGCQNLLRWQDACRRRRSLRNWLPHSHDKNNIELLTIFAVVKVATYEVKKARIGKLEGWITTVHLLYGLLVLHESKSSFFTTTTESIPLLYLKSACMQQQNKN